MHRLTYSYLATKCLFLHDEPCIVRPTLIDINAVELKYYLFMISLYKCTGRCNVLSPKICSKRKKKTLMLKH